MTKTTTHKEFGGAGVLEIVEDDDGSTFRAVYTVRLAGVVYVLHVFQKKSTRGRPPRRRTWKPLALSQTAVSDIVRGRLKNYTLDRLFQCLTALGQDIEIVIRPKQNAAHQARVLVTHLFGDTPIRER